MPQNLASFYAILDIPPKVHSIMTTTIRSIVRTALFGAEYTPSRSVQCTPELESAYQEAKELFALYQKMAVAEGAGTGAGAWANYIILEELREFAMNAYCLRRLHDGFAI
ncbi:EcsC family protein [Paenibacillus macerans]|uniref:EcsC family protein n=1 Tax=Paenibacillus macerans TaxID=44252 RepID=UPI003D31E47E